MSFPSRSSLVHHVDERRVSRCTARRWWRAVALAAAIVQAGHGVLGAQEVTTQRVAYVVRLGAPVDVAAAPAPLRRPVTLHLHDVTVERALGELVERAGLSLTYSRAVVPLDRRITIDIERGSVLDALGQMLGGSGVELWVSAEGRMALVPGERAPATPAQAVSEADEVRAAIVMAALVTGRVTDSASGRPLPGAQVAITGTTLRALTNDAGRYTITGVPAGTHSVRVTALGFAPQTRSVTVIDGQSATVDFTLRVQAVQLEAVVSVGYGTRSTRDVTGAVSAVNTERLATLPVTSVDQALAGQVSGVQVLQSNGIPGGGPQIQVRGVGAIGAGNEPLYVVDGFPLPSGGAAVRNPLADIKPEDIASITVLKDASSASIYGSRAANGVVLVTTKSGRNQPAKVEVSFMSGVEKIPTRGLPSVMNATQFACFQKERLEDQIRFDLGREPTANDVPVEYRTPEQYGVGTNWFDEITRAAAMQDLNVSVSGGTTNIASYVSGGYLKQDGTVIGTDFTRYSVRANVSADVTRRLKLGANFSPVFSTRHLPVEGDRGRNEDGGIGQAAAASPLISPRDAAGVLVPMISSPGTIAFPNPLLALDQLRNTFKSFRGIASGFGELQLADGLLFRSTANVDVSDTRNDTFRPSTVGGVNAPPPRIPVGTYNTSSYVNWLAENTLTYSRLIRAQHKFDVLGGASVQANNSQAGNFTGTNYADDGIPTLNAAPLITGGSDEQDWGLVSYLARLNYSYGDKYLLTLATRADGSSRFAPGNRWGTFPSAAIGWRLSEEPFMKRVPRLDDLKLRASYGRTGNNNLGNYAYVGSVSANNYILNNALASGRGLSSLGNANLGWEKTEEVNLGLDLAMLAHRLSFTAELYRSDTKDLLLNVQVPQSSGFSNITQNTGTVRNQGLELALRTVNVQRQHVTWSSDVNVAINRNRVLALDATGAVIRSGVFEGNPSHITTVGQPVGMFYGYIWDGLYKDSADIKASGSFPGAAPGNVKYRDLNGDGQITPITDFTTIGNPYPKATFGINNQLTVGRFDLSAIMSGQLGGDRLMQFRTYLDNIDGVFNISSDIQNRWRSPSNPGDGVTPTTAGVARSRQLYRAQSTRLVADATHLAVRNVTLRYTAPDRLLRGWVDAGSIYVSLQNALLLSHYPGGNPESTGYNSANSALTPGTDFSPYPVPRILTLGMRFGL
jgi:TonB-dependent starch-binding outer membrane protein SusC